MSAIAPAPVLGVLPCGCIRASFGMAALCEAGQKLKAETKEAHRAADDRGVKGAAKTELCREFDRKRTAYREHIGVGA